MSSRSCGVGSVSRIHKHSETTTYRTFCSLHILFRCSWTGVQNSPPMRPTEAAKQFHFMTCKTTLLAIHEYVAWRHVTKSEQKRNIYKNHKKHNRWHWSRDLSKLTWISNVDLGRSKMLSISFNDVQCLLMRLRCCRSWKNHCAGAVSPVQQCSTHLFVKTQKVPLRSPESYSGNLECDILCSSASKTVIIITPFNLYTVLWFTLKSFFTSLWIFWPFHIFAKAHHSDVQWRLLQLVEDFKCHLPSTCPWQSQKDGVETHFTALDGHQRHPENEWVNGATREEHAHNQLDNLIQDVLSQT